MMKCWEIGIFLNEAKKPCVFARVDYYRCCISLAKQFTYSNKLDGSISVQFK